MWQIVGTHAQRTKNTNIQIQQQQQHNGGGTNFKIMMMIITTIYTLGNNKRARPFQQLWSHETNKHCHRRGKTTHDRWTTWTLSLSPQFSRDHCNAPRTVRSDEAEICLGGRPLWCDHDGNNANIVNIKLMLPHTNEQSSICFYSPGPQQLPLPTQTHMSYVWRRAGEAGNRTMSGNLPCQIKNTHGVSPPENYEIFGISNSFLI